MAKDTKNAIVIDNTEYNLDELSTQQRTLIDHITDLDRKINANRFQLDQLQVGRNSFYLMLQKTLAEEPQQ